MVGEIAGAVQGVIGGIQAIAGARSAKKTQRKLEGMIDSYKPNESIMGYYSKALQRYNSNPYQSTTYQKAEQDSNETFSHGLRALGGRKSAVGGVSRLAAIRNNSMLNAGVAAEREQGQQLNQLGQATGMKAQEDKYKFEGKYNLLAMKSGAANQTANAGISNLFGGIGAIGDAYNIRQMYGDKDTVDNVTPDAGIPSDPWSGRRGAKINYGTINSSYRR